LSAAADDVHTFHLQIEDNPQDIIIQPGCLLLPSHALWPLGIEQSVTQYEVMLAWYWQFFVREGRYS
jgi:hypothetical protein